MNPKKKSKELKRISRENLNGRYRLSMSVFLTVTLINLFSDLPFTYLLGNVYATKVQYRHLLHCRGAFIYRGRRAADGTHTFPP